jgi:hypothetical protein
MPCPSQFISKPYFVFSEGVLRYSEEDGGFINKEFD